MREEGWKELNDKLGPDEKFVQNANEIHKDKYNAYRSVDTFYEGYWDTKANHLYYS